jgi:hypothetical protein
VNPSDLESLAEATMELFDWLASRWTRR